MSSNQSGEGDIRRQLVEHDLVDCMIALPGQLFYTTQIPVCLWFLTRSKKNGKFRDRRGSTLFIDARKLGQLVDRTHRELTEEEIARIGKTYHAWRGEKGAGKYADVPGFCKSATTEEITGHGLRHGDVALSTVRPDRGAYFLCLNPPETLIASTGFAVVTAKAVPWSWIACSLTCGEVFEYLGHHADGGAYPAVNPSLIGAIQYAVPSDTAILDQFGAVCSHWFMRAHENRDQMKRLATTRDSLLPRLLSGELRVGDTDRRLAGAT